MRATHKLVYWQRFVGAHKFEKTLRSYKCRFKKDGTLMAWRGTHLVCMGARPPHLFYFKNKDDVESVRRGYWKDSFGTKKWYQFYYTLEKL